MFEKFDDGARQALFCARYEAGKAGSHSIGCEHLLLGILVAPIVKDALGHAQVSIPDLVAELQVNAGTFSGTLSDEIPLAEKAKRVLRRALAEAAQMHDEHVGPEHILIGLARDEHSTTAPILRRHGVDPDRVRDHVLATRPGRGTAGARAGGAEVRTYLIVIEPSASGFSAYVPDLPGCVATGRDRSEVEREMKGAIDLHLEGLKAGGMDIPEPGASSSYVEIPT